MELYVDTPTTDLFYLFPAEDGNLSENTVITIGFSILQKIIHTKRNEWATNGHWQTHKTVLNNAVSSY